MRMADTCLDTSVADYFSKLVKFEKSGFFLSPYEAGNILSDWPNSDKVALLIESAQNNGYLEYIKHPAKMITNHQKSKMAKIEQGLSTLYKTVLKLFGDEESGKFQALWLTDTRLSEVTYHRPINYDNFLNYIEQSTKAIGSGYKTIIWTNLDKETFWNIHPLFKQGFSEFIEIKNLADLDTEYVKLKDLLLSPDKYLPKTDDKAKYTGFLVDLAKYLILEKEGGLLADLNFKFVQDFDPMYLEHYDYIGNRCLAGGLARIENNFFYSKPHHPIFKETLNIIEEMIFNPSFGNSMLLNAGLRSTPFTELYSMMPYSIGYIKGFNQDGNNDALHTIVMPGSPGYSCEELKKRFTKSGQEFSPELKAKIADYEALGYNLENLTDKDQLRAALKEFKQIEDMLYEYQSYQCVDGSLVGADTQAMSWGSASLF